MNKLWISMLLMGLIFPRVDEDGAEDTELDEGVDPELDEGSEGTELDEGTDDTEFEPVVAKQESRAAKEIRALRERAQKAETDHQRAMAELAEARKAPAQPTHEQKLWEQEEAVLKNPATEEWQRYAVQSARDARDAKRESTAARFDAKDLADKAEFDKLSTSMPKTYSGYKDRVEATLVEARKAGNNPSRKNIAAFLIGQDMLDGKLKSTEGKPKKTGGVPRGSTPGVRSDAPAGAGRMTDIEKVRKRLENVRI